MQRISGAKYAATVGLHKWSSELFVLLKNGNVLLILIVYHGEINRCCEKCNDVFFSKNSLLLVKIIAGSNIQPTG